VSSAEAGRRSAQFLRDRLAGGEGLAEVARARSLT